MLPTKFHSRQLFREPAGLTRRGEALGLHYTFSSVSSDFILSSIHHGDIVLSGSGRWDVILTGPSGVHWHPQAQAGSQALRTTGGIFNQARSPSLLSTPTSAVPLPSLLLFPYLLFPLTMNSFNLPACDTF